MDHFRKFDAVRGVAAIAVLFMHVVDVYVTRLTGPDHRAIHLAEILARHAVLVFFLLSGYLITLSILLNVKRHGRFDGVSYLTSRISRIYPPLIGAMILILLIWLVIHGLNLPGAVSYGLPTDRYTPVASFSVSGKELLLALLMHDGLMGPDPSLWSLYVEFHLYLIAMLVAMAWTARAGRRYWYLTGAVALFALWSYLWVWFIVYAVVWALGAIMAIANNEPARASLAAGVSAGAAIGAAAVLIVWLALAHGLDAFVVNRIPLLPGFIVQLLCCVCYLYLLFGTRKRGWRVPSFLVATGNFSYSLYVIHYPLLLLGLSLAQDWMGNELSKTAIVAVLSIPPVLLISMWFARYFEDQKRFGGPIHRALFSVRSLLGGASSTGAARETGS